MTPCPDESLCQYIHRYSKVHYAVPTKTAQETTDTSRSFRFLSSINNIAKADSISRSEHFPRNLQEFFKKALVLVADYKLSDGINLACVANVMSIQTAGGDLSEIKSDDARARSNTCWRCGEVGHFHRDCLKLNAQAQSGDNVHIVIGKMTHILTANSPVKDMVFNSIFKH